MGKQIIRLTESDLHNLVKESVNKILTELDWRTMASASKKAKERGDDREEKFAKGATDAFNKTHGIDRTFKDTYSSGREKSTLNYDIRPDGYDDYYTHKTLDTPRHKAPALNYSLQNSINYDDNGNVHYGINYDDSFHGDRVNGMPNYTPNYDDIKVMNKNERELDNFFKGKSEYVPKKGWKQRR